MRNLVVIVHVSLDGFVAGPNGELDEFEVGDENLAFVCTLTENADAALFGRVSYKLLDDYWPLAKDRPNATKSEILFSNWYNNAQKVVISKTMIEAYLTNTIVIREDLSTEINKLKEQAGKDILIFGSLTVTQLLMQLDLIDSYWIFVNPIVFGQGIPLFNGLAKKINLNLVAIQSLPNGEIALNYSVNR